MPTPVHSTVEEKFGHCATLAVMKVLVASPLIEQLMPGGHVMRRSFEEPEGAIMMRKVCPMFVPVCGANCGRETIPNPVPAKVAPNMAVPATQQQQYAQAGGIPGTSNMHIQAYWQERMNAASQTLSSPVTEL